VGGSRVEKGEGSEDRGDGREKGGKVDGEVGMRMEVDRLAWVCGEGWMVDGVVIGIWGDLGGCGRWMMLVP